MNKIKDFIFRFFNWAKGSSVALWILILLLNTFFFVPEDLIGSCRGCLLPLSKFLGVDGFTEKLEWLFNRDLTDIWKICLEYFGLIFFGSVIVRIWPKSRKAIWLLAPLLYFPFHFFRIYEATIFKLYFRRAEFLHDYFLIKNGFDIVVNEPWMLAALITFLVIYSLLLFTLFRFVFYHSKIGTVYRSYPMIVIVLLFIVSLTVVGFGSKKATFRSLSHQIYYYRLEALKNQKYRTREYDRLHEGNKIYGNYLLEKKPNVFVIFIESYGERVLGRDSINDQYSKTIKMVEERLYENKFFSTSNLSISPTYGGGSWIAFSSALYGFHIRYHSLFDFLVNKPGIDSTYSYFRWLQNQGYEGYFLSPFKPKNYLVPVEEYKRFYGLQNWLGYEYFEHYKGFTFGWNDPPNDQYTINYAYDLIKQKQNRPTALFFMTKNSHYPYHSPPESAVDWKSLVTKVGEPVPKADASLDRYISAISFQLDYLTRFIADEGGNNDIFILAGDHQPPKIDEDQSHFETPMHIISKDSALVASFKEYGFVDGMMVSQKDNMIRHEAFLSMMIREMVRNYSADSTNLPEYKPEGIR